MRQIQLLNALRRAGTCIVFALVGLAAASQQMIDLAKTPVLCNQTHTFKLKEVLPDGYSYYYDSEGTEIVLTRDQGKANRYTSKFPQSPYIHSCDYVVKKLGQTVTMIAWSNIKRRIPTMCFLQPIVPRHTASNGKSALKKVSPFTECIKHARAGTVRA